VICDRPITVAVSVRKHLGAVCLRQSLAASGDGNEVHTVEDSPTCKERKSRVASDRDRAATSRQVTQASETEHTGATCPQVVHCRQESPARQEKVYRQETSGGNEGTATMEAYDGDEVTVAALIRKHSESETVR
jgi:hypothetical protein